MCRRLGALIQSGPWDVNSKLTVKNGVGLELTLSLAESAPQRSSRRSPCADILDGEHMSQIDCGPPSQMSAFVARRAPLRVGRDQLLASRCGR